MLTRICLSLALLVAVPVWAQVEPSATGPPPSSEDAMKTPPPVSGETYPTATGSEERSNYLRVGLNFETSYDDNLVGVESTAPVADIAYSIRPTIAFDQVNSRLHQTFTYSPGFTFYQHTSGLNEADQSASAIFQYRLSPHAAVSLRDSFLKSTNVFNQPYAGVSGSTQPATAAVVAPFADQISNLAGGDISYQFSSNGMIGGGGTFTVLNYPNPAQASGLPNSNSFGASAFYNLRLSSNQYTGVTYQYSSMTATSPAFESATHTQTIYAFYTLYLKHSLSLSASGGPQHFTAVQSPLPASASWTPAVTASVGWQVPRANIAASYSRTITGAGGLLGTFESSSASADARWQFARTWSAGSAASYSVQNNVLPAFFASMPGGHTVSGTVSIQHPIGEHYTAECGYTRLHQSYSGIGLISQYPDSNREYISISYQFTRPLGR